MAQRDPCEYFAFISYSSHDTRWGWRLQRKLEHYRMPATLCRERGWKRHPIDSVFFAPTEIQPGALPPELERRLRASRHLIVICSPHSAQSEWVGREIRYFHSLGRADRIHLFIVEGTPHSGDSATECFHPILKELGMPEMLGANIHEPNYRWRRLNRERAYVQLISKLLDVSFDSLWRRHRRLFVQGILCWMAGAILVAAALIASWCMNRPTDVSITLEEVVPRNAALPPFADAVVSLEIDGKIETDTVSGSADKALFRHVPHRFLGEKARVRVVSRDFCPVDTLMKIREVNSLVLKRDTSVYGAVCFRLWNAAKGRPAAYAHLRVGQFAARSDADGYVKLQIPSEHQSCCYPLKAELPLADTMLYMPCNEHSVVLVLTH